MLNYNNKETIYACNFLLFTTKCYIEFIIQKRFFLAWLQSRQRLRVAGAIVVSSFFFVAADVCLHIGDGLGDAAPEVIVLKYSQNSQ